MIILQRLLLLLTAIILTCTIPTSTGNGTGTDAGEARVYGTVKLPGDNAAADVTVILRKQDYLPYSIPSSDQVQTFSGDNGSFTLSTTTRGYHLVELLGSDSLRAVKRFRITDEATIVELGDLTLDTAVAVAGMVLADGAPVPGGSLLVMGFDNKGEIASDGSFSLRLPAGDQLFRVVAGNGLHAGDVLFTGNRPGTIDTIQASTVPATVLEDFENSDGFNRLSPLLGGGSWFAFTDTVNGGTSTVEPTEEPGLVAAIDRTSAAFTGGSLHCTFNIGQSFSAPFALIGMDISNSKDADSPRSSFDLSAMSAFSFMVKGTGNITVQFTCKPVGTSTDFLVFEIPVTLTSEWKKHSIGSAAIPDESVSGTPWEDARVAVSNINFLATSSTDLWLDNLTVEGMTVTDFLK